VSFAEEDRIFADDIERIKNVIADFSFVQKVNDFAGSKNVRLNEGYDEFQV
jgi:histidine ammonia-lyase